MNTKEIEMCLRYVDHPNAEMMIRGAERELRMLNEKIAEQELLIQLKSPNYDSLSEVAKAELRAAAKGSKTCLTSYDAFMKAYAERNESHDDEKQAPGEVNAVHDDAMDAMVYSFNSMVNHPKHYNKGRYEVIDIIESILESMELTPVEAMLTAQVVKYIARWKNKNGVEDLKKAEWYLRRLIG